MEEIIIKIREELSFRSDEKTRATSQRFFKEKIKFHGVKVPLVHRISKDYFSHIETRSKTEIFELCEMLWQSGFIEESFIACNWSYYVHKKYEPEDFWIFKGWISKYVNNWASCDTLCNHTVGEFIQKFPEYLEELKKFAVSENRWMRRAAAVSLIIPARKGMFPDDIFQISDILLEDKDDLVQKGYGWMLKAASEANRQAVFDYVVRNKAVIPRTALRYAIEKMPEELRKAAMARL
jgi:3-methyladenine DNA glycosylase AlkD